MLCAFAPKDAHMRPSETAKFALKTLVICANAHCGKPSLTAERLANIFIGQAGRVTVAEKKIIKEILSQADSGLVGRALREAGAENERIVEIIRELA